MTSPTQRAIEDANKAGYDKIMAHKEEGTYFASDISIHAALLDPEFWRCLVKEREWKDDQYHVETEPKGLYRVRVMWSHKWWHSFIDYLCDGFSIDDALSRLEK